jgi:hypothetical protein
MLLRIYLWVQCGSQNKEQTRSEALKYLHCTVMWCDVFLEESEEDEMGGACGAYGGGEGCIQHFGWEA